MVSPRVTDRSLDLARANVQAGLDAALTIAARAQGLMAPGGASGEKLREAQRMVQEKLAAGVEGAFAAQVAWGSFLLKAAFGGVSTAHDVSMAAADIAEAALAPPIAR